MIEKIGYIGSIKSDSGKIDKIIININGEDTIIDLTFPISEKEIKNYVKKCILNGEPSKIKVLNKNDKLYKSKMFIDKKAYSGICRKAGYTLEEHLQRVNTPAETDMDKKILSTVTRKITKIIR